MKRFLTAALLGLVIAGAGAAVPSGALAHSELVSSDPVDGAVLDGAPQAVTFTFNEDLLPDFVRIIATGPGGDTGDLVVSAVEGPTATADWPAAAEPGEWTVNYRVVSQDGHPIEGGITFAYVEPEPTSPTAEPTSATPVPDPTSATPVPINESATPIPIAEVSAPGPSPLAIAAIVLVILGGAGVAIAVIVRRRA